MQVDTKLNCFIEQEDDRAFIYINLLDNNLLNMTLQFADITNEFKDFSEINDHFSLYSNIEELIIDLENGHLQRFLDQPKDNDRLDLMVNLRMKMKHQKGTCGDSCILCNPDIGDDPFPDFVFDIRNAEPEGEC